MTHILIVEAPYYRDISAELLAGAEEALKAAGATWDVIQVPGAFEIPAAIALAAGLNLPAGRVRARYYDGYLGLGVVIRGETTHYDYVCGESARGLQDLALRHGLAVGFGILTVENDDQAWARASRTKKNKGAEVANAALAMVALKNRLTVPA
ncbi:MAG TPA: 6,7-dimethyl-8-ribityllumazine synthase [Aliidongia sp.]|nr:6,7-dimethyl-8-ribityllumazine synthase [Aliidongia sp.]